MPLIRKGPLSFKAFALLVGVDRGCSCFLRLLLGALLLYRFLWLLLDVLLDLTIFAHAYPPFDVMLQARLLRRLCTDVRTPVER